MTVPRNTCSNSQYFAITNWRASSSKSPVRSFNQSMMEPGFAATSPEQVQSQSGNQFPTRPERGLVPYWRACEGSYVAPTLTAHSCSKEGCIVPACAPAVTAPVFLLAQRLTPMCNGGSGFSNSALLVVPDQPASFGRRLFGSR